MTEAVCMIPIRSDWWNLFRDCEQLRSWPTFIQPQSLKSSDAQYDEILVDNIRRVERKLIQHGCPRRRCTLKAAAKELNSKLLVWA